MRRGNAGQVGAYRAPTSGIVSISELQQAKSIQVVADVLLLAGGGGGETAANSKPGAGGGVLFQSVVLTKGSTYLFGIGSGGAPNVSGANTTFGSLVAYGGGKNINTCGAGQDGVINPMAGSTLGVVVGSARWIAGGGGSVCSGIYGESMSGGAGGKGGGGNAPNQTQYQPGITGGSGVANTGGGGSNGSGYAGAGAPGGNGGSGGGSLSVLTSQYTGIYTGSPTIVVSGSYTVLTWITTGTYTA